MFIRLSYPRHDPRNLLLAVVLAFAVLDHTRMFFYYWNTNPVAIANTSLAVFLTRFLSHFFAPAVMFILGIEIFLYCQRYGSTMLNKALCCTGGILLLLELLVNNFLYTFDIYYRTIGLFILGLIGLCLICMIGLHYLGRKAVLIISLTLLLGHNLLDKIQFEGHSLSSICWYLLHQQKFIAVDDRMFIVNYTLIPWLAVLMLGYHFGKLYLPYANPKKRKQILIIAGWLTIALFVVLRFLNNYGDPVVWHYDAQVEKTVMSFLNLTKYPASLDYLSLTLGPIFLFLGYTADIKIINGIFFTALAKRPLFVYLFSTLLIHFIAMVFLWVGGNDIASMVITSSSYKKNSPLAQYGYPIEIVYLLWTGIILLLCCLCSVERWFGRDYEKS